MTLGERLSTKQLFKRNFQKNACMDFAAANFIQDRNKEILWVINIWTEPLSPLAIIGAVNWGLIGLFRFDLVAFLFGDMSWLSRIVYVLVGISGLYLVSFFLHLGDNEA